MRLSVPGTPVWSGRLAAAVLAAVCLCLVAPRRAPSESVPAAGPSPPAEAPDRRLSLEECIDLALRNSQVRPVSQLAVEIAEAQHAQAMSSWWPQVKVVSSLSLRDEDPIFVFPEDTDVYTFNLLGEPMAAAVTVPAKRVKLQDRLHMANDLDIIMALYTGGLRGGLIQQAEAGIEASRQAARRTDLELRYDVTRYYYGAVLTESLLQIGDEAVARLQVTLDLTENLYRHGTGTVKKTDWLSHKVAFEGLRAVVEGLRGNRDLARAALANTMGMPWDSTAVPSASQVPVKSVGVTTKELVAASLRYSPDWARLRAGLDAAEGAIAVAGSGRLPKLALVGNVEVLANSHDAGIVSKHDKKSWVVALGVEVPLFDGNLTRNRLREARARLRQLEHQRERLRQGLGLQVKAAVLDLARVERQLEAARAAAAAAGENRRLHVRAHQDQLVETQALIAAQLTESVARAAYQKMRYDHAVARARIDLVVGAEVAALLEEGEP